MFFLFQLVIVMDFPIGVSLIRNCMKLQDMVDIAWIVMVTEMDQIVKDVEIIIISVMTAIVYLVTVTK